MGREEDRINLEGWEEVLDNDKGTLREKQRKR